MGIFNFVSDIGKKLFNVESEGSKKIREYIEKDNPGIDGLKVDYDNEVVKISGVAKNQDALQKTALMAGNIQGVKEVLLDDVSLENDITEEPRSFKVEIYSVQPGDTLSKIASDFYHDANQYKRIFEDNKEVIKSPDLIYPGQKIRIVMDKTH